MGKRDKRSLEERFWEKVDKGGPGDCWNWRAAKYRDAGGGYRPHFNVSRESGVVISYRLAYELHYGVKPSPRTVVCHTCDNGLCCNPNHLMLSSQRANVQDSARKGRRNVPRLRRPEDTVRQAFVLHRSGLSIRATADLLGISKQTVGQWLSGKHRHTVWEEFNGKPTEVVGQAA